MSFELGDSPEWAPETHLSEAITYDEEPAPTMTWTLDWDDDISAEEPMVVNELATEEPMANELLAEEPVATELVTEEPVANELLAEEPVATELVTEEPVATELVTEEPVATEPIRKTVGLDELLAFEAQLRGEVPAPTAQQPEAIETFDAFETSAPIEAPVEASFEVPTAEATFDAPIEEPAHFETPKFEVEFETPVFEQASFEAEAQAAAPQVSNEIRVEVRPAVAQREPVQIDPDRDSLEDTMRRMAQERRAYLQAYSHRFGQAQQRIQQGDMDRPAFERQGWNLDASANYSKEQSLGEHMVRGEKNDLEFRPHNSFLHDNVD
jgi:hypothetical protein